MDISWQTPQPIPPHTRPQEQADSGQRESRDYQHFAQIVHANCALFLRGEARMGTRRATAGFSPSILPPSRGAFDFSDSFKSLFDKGGALDPRQLGIHAIEDHQLFVSAAFHNLSVTQDENLVGLADRA
jgi:hypothetical protein